MTCSGNPKADRHLCQIDELFLPSPHLRSVVHSESNML